MNTNTLSLMLIIVFVSFLGFITENIFISFRSGVMDNRNMVLPFLLGYGLAIFIIYKLFGTPNAPLLFGSEMSLESTFARTLFYFAIAFLCVSIGEIMLGYLIEFTCGIEWWDYSSIPLHITQYTSVPTSVVFSILITIFMKYLFSPLLNIFSKINASTLSILAISMIVILSIDFIHSGIYMLKNHRTLNLWRIEFKRPIKERLMKTHKGN